MSNKNELEKLENKLIVKSNQIIEAYYRMNLQEQRIIAYMCAHIQPYDNDFKPIKIRISDFATLIKVEDPNYFYMQKVTRELLEKVLTLKEENHTLQIGWLSSAQYFHGLGYVELCFDPKLKPYLLKLKEQFTQYYFKYVIRFRHCYSIRIYELLKQYEPIGHRYFELIEFKLILGIEPAKYKNFNDLKRRVLEPVKAEFDEKYFKKHELDLTFDYHPKKEGRKVIGIYLDIRTNTPSEKLLESQADTSKKTNHKNEPLSELLEMKISKRQANSLIKKYAPDVIQRNIELTKKRAANEMIDNVPAFLVDAIKNDYAKDSDPANPESRELRTEAIACWNKNKGSCRAKWSTYKDNRSKACHYCLRFKDQRNK